MQKKIKYSVVIPAYNEELVLQVSYERLTQVMIGMGESYELIFINDGSRDKTREILLGLNEADQHVKVLDFSRNFGHQVAVTAGLEHASGDAVVIIDADLQDPPELIPEMVKKWREGFDVVYGKRKKRKGETFFKKFTASAFYRFLRKMSGQPIPVDTGDFRLVDRRVVDAICAMKEHNRFLRGMFAWIGFRQCPVEYERDARFAGETKYTLKKMVKLASDGIVSFSAKPLKIATVAGIVVMFLSVIYALVMLIVALCGNMVSYVHFLFALLFLLNGLCLCCIGLLGSYLGRVYDEVKGRPVYLLQGKYGFDEPIE